MMISLSIATNQITTLVTKINKRNYKSSVNELYQLLNQFRGDAEYHLLRILLYSIDFANFVDGKAPRDFYRCQLLSSQVIPKIINSDFATILCKAFCDPIKSQTCLYEDKQILTKLSKLLSLDKIYEVLLGLCLIQSVEREVVLIAKQWLHLKLPDIFDVVINKDYLAHNGEYDNFTAENLNFILLKLEQDVEQYGISTERLLDFRFAIKKSFLQHIKKNYNEFLYITEDNLEFSKENKSQKLDDSMWNEMNDLANIMERMGPISTQNIEDLSQRIQNFDINSISPNAIAQCICMLMRVSQSSTVSDWNLEKFFTVVFDKNPSLNRQQIIEMLDCKEFDASTKGSLHILRTCIDFCVDPFPIDFFYSQWKNSASHLTFLRSCSVNKDIISLSWWPHRTCDLPLLNFDDRHMMGYTGLWANMDYIDAILRLSDMGLMHEVNDLLSVPLSTDPHILVCSLTQSTVINDLKSRLLIRLFSLFASNSNQSTSIFHLSWQTTYCRPLILRALFECYKESCDLSCVPRIGKLVTDLKAMEYVLPSSGNPSFQNIFRDESIAQYHGEVIHFALDVTIFCSDKNVDFLNQWVRELLSHKDSQTKNFTSIVSYIDGRYSAFLDDQKELMKTTVPKEIIFDPNSLLDVVTNLDRVASQSSAVLTEMISKLRSLTEKMTNTIQLRYVEQEIDKNFKLLFQGSITVQLMCDLYCNPSKSTREQLCCLVRVLLEELTFVSQYPERLGVIFSDLFSRIMKLDNTDLISKEEIRQLYNSLLEVRHTLLNGPDSSGSDIIERIINSVQPPDTNCNPENGPITIDDIESPPESVAEKVFFAINNMSKSNLQKKAAVLSKLIGSQYLDWFAQHIVGKRICNEANFQELFVQLIDSMADKVDQLRESVLSETLWSIQILLGNMNSDLSDFGDRQLLKNLGKFLGLITLARNKPIVHDEIDLKEVLYEAFHKGRVELHYVVPFVTRTMEAAKDSVVFRPPCPWTTAILRVLKELHSVDSVQLNLKFEIEILCRNLQVDFNKLQASFYLNDMNVNIEKTLCRVVTSNAHTQPPKNVQSTPEVQPAPTDCKEQPHRFPVAMIDPPGLQIDNSPSSINVPYDELSTSSVSGYLNFDELPPQILIIIPNIKSQLIVTIDKIVSELVLFLYERFAKITTSTVDQLISKDFGVDCEIGAVRQYASGMCRHLTAGLCLVTAQGMVTANLGSVLKQTVVGQCRHLAAPDRDQLDLFVSGFVARNTDICVAFLQKMVSERAVLELEKKMSISSGSISQKLNQQPNVISQDLQVYEHFCTAVPGFPSEPPSPPFLAARHLPLDHPAARLLSDLERHFAAIRQRLSEADVSGLQRVAESARSVLIGGTGVREQLARDVVGSLARSWPSWGALGPAAAARIREVHLCGLRLLQPRPEDEEDDRGTVAGLVTSAWGALPDDLRWAAGPFSELLCARAVSLPLVDAAISTRLLDSGGVSLETVAFLLELLQRFVINEDGRQPMVVSEVDLVASLDALADLLRRGDAPESVVTTASAALTSTNRLLALGNLGRPPPLLYVGASLCREEGGSTARERAEAVARLWLECYCSPRQRDEGHLAAIATGLTQMRLTHSEPAFAHFVRNTTLRAVTIGEYVEIDAHALLLATVIVRSRLSRSRLLGLAMGTVAGCLLRAAVGREPTMPFQRLLLMLLRELLDDDDGDIDWRRQIVASFAHTLHLVRPQVRPGFAFCWLELLAHRRVITAFLVAPGNCDAVAASNQGWPLYATLLADLYGGLAPFLENLQLPQSVRSLYRGTLSLTCVLAHDFPLLLIAHHTALCGPVPLNCYQLRNVILAATPRNGHRDGASPEEIPEDPPCALPLAPIAPLGLRRDLDSFLATRTPLRLLSDLICRLSSRETGPGPHYDTGLMAEIVMHLCVSAVASLRQTRRPITMETVANTPQMDVFQSLLVNLGSEGRFLILHSMANQLRYRNSHSCYFVAVFLYLFEEQPHPQVREQIARVVLERAIVNRPHPWALISLMQQLFHDRGRIAEYNFVRSSEVVEMIIDSVLKGCCGAASAVDVSVAAAAVECQ